MRRIEEGLGQKRTGWIEQRGVGTDRGGFGTEIGKVGTDRRGLGKIENGYGTDRGGVGTEIGGSGTDTSSEDYRTIPPQTTRQKNLLRGKQGFTLWMGLFEHTLRDMENIICTVNLLVFAYM